VAASVHVPHDTRYFASISGIAELALARRSVPAVISEIALCTLAAEHGATYYIKQYMYIHIYYIKALVFFFFERVPAHVT
jgi:hypothetical protein